LNGSPVVVRQPSPELLDELSVLDPRARASRKDLRRLNGIMRHAPLMVDAWQQNHPDRWIDTIVELGAGDGTFLLNFARAIAPESRPLKVILVDRMKLAESGTLDGFRELGWQPQVVTADVFEWLGQVQGADAAVFCNLFLHHFDHGRLARLFDRVATFANLFLALEPRRSLGALACSKMVGLIGCNNVTRHDAVVSVRAGFKDKEITSLWPSRGWYVHEAEVGLFSHCFTAQRFCAATPKGCGEGGVVLPADGGSKVAS
jgi:hypothetical protein